MTDIVNTVSKSLTHDAKSLVESYIAGSVALSAKNTLAQKLQHEASAERVARLVASMIVTAYACEGDDKNTKAMLVLAVEKGISRPGPEDNRFLALARLSHGRENEEGEWKPAPGIDKYASAIRVAVENKNSADEFVQYMVGRETVSVNGKMTRFTLTNLVLADRAKHGEARQRSVFTPAAIAKATGLIAMVSVELDAKQKRLFTLSEGYTLAVVRLTDSHLEILGDAGKKGNEVFRSLMDLGPSEPKAAKK